VQQHAATVLGPLPLLQYSTIPKLGLLGLWGCYSRTLCTTARRRYSWPRRPPWRRSSSHGGTDASPSPRRRQTLKRKDQPLTRGCLLQHQMLPSTSLAARIFCHRLQYNCSCSYRASWRTDQQWRPESAPLHRQVQVPPWHHGPLQSGSRAQGTCKLNRMTELQQPYVPWSLFA
jgi:hypothetical protein